MLSLWFQLMVLTVRKQRHLDSRWISASASFMMTIRNSTLRVTSSLLCLFVTLHEHTGVLLPIAACSFPHCLTDVKYFVTSKCKCSCFTFMKIHVRYNFPQMFCILKAGIICQK